MSVSNIKHSKNPRKVADHAFLRIHFEISKTMDLIDDLAETLTQLLEQHRGKDAAQAVASKYYCKRCVRRRNARGEVADRVRTLQVLASEQQLSRAA